MVSVRPLTQTNEDSPKGLSQRPPNTKILNNEQGNRNITDPTTSKNYNQEWRTVNNSSKQPKEAIKSHIVETKNKYSILRRLEDSVDCEFTLLGNSMIKEEVDIFCNRGRKIWSRLCIPGGNIKNISDVVSKLEDSRWHVVTHVGTNNLVQRSYGYRNRQVPNRNSEEIHRDFRQLINTLGQRNKKSFLVGILPRMNTSNERLGRAFSMNNTVNELCKTSNVGYIDMWDEFIGLKHFFTDDGLHLSYLGCRKFASILERALSDLGFWKMSKMIVK